MEITREKEIRSLDVSITQRLANHLDDDSILSLLMGNIVKDFGNPNSELRFTSADIDSIRNHAQQLRINPILTLLNEWGTMGRNRPKVHHLLTLLIKCQLFRAADYIARLIGEPCPIRPTSGPAARVDITLPDNIESVVNGLYYPYSTVEANRENCNVKPTMNIPRINLEANSDSKVNNISIPFIKPVSPSNGSIFKSDLIGFSERNFSTLAAPAVRITSQNISSVQQLRNQIPMTVNSEANLDISRSQELPAFSRLISDGDLINRSQELPAVLRSINNISRNDATNSFAGLPAFSAIMGGDSQSTLRQTSSENSDRSDTDDSDTNKQ